MAEEEKVEGNADELAQMKTKIDELNGQVNQLRGKTTEYERLLLDPTYLEYVSGRGTQGAKRDEPKEEKVDIDNLSPKELAEYIISTVRGEIRQNLQPIRQDAEVTKAVAELKELQADPTTSDVMEYKEDMLKIAMKHPTLAPREVYMLAKSQANRKPSKPSKPSETPTGGSSSKRKPVEGFEGKFMEAWRSAGLAEKE